MIPAARLRRPAPAPLAGTLTYAYVARAHRTPLLVAAPHYRFHWADTIYADAGAGEPLANISAETARRPWGERACNRHGAVAGDGALEPVTTRGEFGELLYEAPPRRAAAARSASVLGELGTDNFAERPRHDSTPPQLVRPADGHHSRACIVHALTRTRPF